MTIKRRNWSIYNKKLVERGRVTVYLKPAVLKQDVEINEMNDNKVGRPYRYGKALIFAIFAVKCFFGIGYRETEGYMDDFSSAIGLNIVPNFRTIWRRIMRLNKDDINFNVKPLRKNEKVEVAIDSTGIKTVNDGEYRTRKYAKKKDWIKFHLTVDVRNGMALTEDITVDRVHDNERFTKLLTPISENINAVDGDGAYDSENSFRWCQEHNVKCNVRVRINARLGHGKRKKAVIEQFDIRKFRDKLGHYRKNVLSDNRDRRRYKQDQWKKKVGFGKRWMVEGAYSRFKGMFGEYVFSKKWDMMVKEVRAKLYVYNMTL